MDKIWAPWRKKYVTHKKPESCIFCAGSKESQDEKNYIVKRTKHSFVMLNIFPYNNGHLMAAPYKHTPDLNDLSEEELIDLMNLVRLSQRLLKKVLKPAGFNIGMNIGTSAGAGVADHLHIHIVPRWTGDTNFMPIIADTKLISESLDSLYKSLKDVEKD